MCLLSSDLKMAAVLPAIMTILQAVGKGKDYV